LNALRPGCCRAADNLYELPTQPVDAPAPVLLLEADHCALEDIGWIRRMVATGRLAGVVAMGTDPAQRVARALRSLPGARWAPWPPDLEELKALLANVDSQAAPSRAASSAGSNLGQEREAELPARAAQSAPRSAPRTSPAPARVEHPSQSPRTEAPSAALSLTIGRDQVAVLADISQRLELAFLGLRESGRALDADLESPALELRRLLRFTRSLACLAAPPPRGADEFEVTGLIEELLATLTLRGRKGPRFQPSSGPIGRPALEFVVRADRAALTLAFETVLSLARLCATGGDTVRVAYTPLNGSSLSIGIEFPAGPLHDVRPDQLFDVAVLRERLPELGPNELAAAGAILRSQGGDMEVLAPSEGQLAIRMRLPVERSTRSAGTAARSDPRPEATRAGESAKTVAHAPRTRVDDPFA
jgi:hypothetical protein